MQGTQNELKQIFKQSILDNNLRNIILVPGLAFLALVYYLYADLFVHKNIFAAYTRVTPMLLAVFLIVFQLLTKDKYKKTKTLIYYIFLTSALIMMYGKCLVHIHDISLPSSVTGTILVIFIVSLELKANLFCTALIYFLPIIIFTIIIMFFENLSKIEFNIIADIYPIVLAGFIINRVQYKLRFNLFKSNYLLREEKQKTEQLFEETVAINEKLKESNITKEKFISIIAHDLKNPFFSIIGFSQLLVDNFDKYDVTTQKMYIEKIYNSVTYTHKLLDNILTWTFLQKKSIEIKLENENLFLLVKDTLELFKETLNEKSILLSNQIKTDINIKVDKNLLATILRNLVSNAIKFTPNGGNIKITSDFITVDNINYIKISVKDSGVGISKEKLLKLFKITEKVSTKGTNNETGTGLGLILCKEFVEKHGGKIWVESEAGNGSNFIFTIQL